MPTPTPAPAPAASVVIDIAAPELLSTTALNSLANSSSTATLSYSNPFSKTYADVIIELDAITPTGSPQIKISDGTTEYYLDLTTTYSKKSVVFADIATSFLNSFTVTNSTGVTLASNNNFITIKPK